MEIFQYASIYNERTVRDLKMRLGYV